MRKYILIVVVMMSFSAYAFRITDNHLFMQKDSIQPNNSSVTEKVEPDQYPKMRDCQDADGTIEGFKKCLINYLNENVQNPENLDGRAYLVFKVNTEGKVEKIRTHSNHNALIEEGERLLKQMPLFIPAQKAGKSIDFVYSIPLVFKNVKSLKEERYFHDPDEQARWEGCEKDKKGKSLSKCIQDFILSRIELKEEKRGVVHMVLKIDSDGNSMVEGVDGENEDLVREVFLKSREFPKFIPAIKNGKPVGSINLIPVSLDEDEEDEISGPPDVFPQIKFCNSSFQSSKQFQMCLNYHVQDSFEYPELAVKYNIQGTVFVVFKVKKDRSIQILRTWGDETNILRNEAIRVIKKIPIKTPAMKEGKPVSLVFVYPINFKLNQFIDY